MSEEFAQAQTVTIGDLLEKGYTYLIPDYQRGYRWQRSHIRDLMNDVWHSTEKDWNCIQPIIVSHRNKDKYTLVDGQQRLTTISLILKHLNENEFNLEREDVNNEEDSINKQFKEYAEGTVEDWIKENLKKNPEEEKRKFITNLKEYTKVIWYEVNEDKAIEVFTRININRIPLTAAELLKAMILRKLTTSINIDIQPNATFQQQNEIKSSLQKLIYIETRQIEISHQWNEIESTLQDDRFWLMFNEKNDQDSCRISRIFRIAYACEIQQNKEQNKDNEREISENDSEKAVFRYFLSKIQPDKNEGDEMAELERIEKTWHEIENIYRALRDWYEDVDTFHLVCMYFIVNKSASVSKLYTDWDTKTRKTFRDELRKRIKNELFGDKSDVKTTIDKCDYKSDYSRIKNILLLHNVATTMLRNWPQHRWNEKKLSNERYLKNMCSRFPFHMYKIAKWNLEHISPCSGDSNDPKQREEFIKCLRGSLTDGILRQKLKDEDPSKLEKLIKQFIETDNNPDMRNSIAEKILEILEDSNIYKPFEDQLQHSIKNLALLDEGTNKSYRNNIFADKRKAILERIGEKDENAPTLSMNEYSFIMPCTLNAFSKTYTKEHNNLLFWGENDANDYGEDMIKTISHFLALELETENN